jgi:hypothetical protein
MICNRCGNKVKVANKFCEHCGEQVPQVRDKEPASASQEPSQPASASVDVSNLRTKTEAVRILKLQAWAGWTWLVAKKYGELTITETHLEYQIKKFWSTNAWSIISKVFNWGFDWLTSLFVGKGSSDLRAVSNVKVYALDWLAWKAHALVISTTGMPAVYLFSAKQLPEVEAFIETLKLATANAKFVTKVGN